MLSLRRGTKNKRADRLSRCLFFGTGNSFSTMICWVRGRVSKVIRIPTSIYHRMIEHARRESPAECCGILGGREGTVHKAFEVENAEESFTRYSISAQEQLRIFEEMDQESMEMIATYHSHPHTLSFPSQTDLELAPYPEVTVVIVSLKEENNPVVNAFRIDQEGIDPREIKIIENGSSAHSAG